ncbi:MAG: TIGR01777 family oxidoreductase [Thioalkalispiraceae bacterium]|jgi:hypothetical protein
MIELLLTLLIIQALLGAFDTLYHHELKVALPRQASAQTELILHAFRSILYAVLFIGLAWFEWQGSWVWLIVTIVLIELILTLWDFVVEDQTRQLPGSERITHTLLAINAGAIFLLLAFVLVDWQALPAQLVFIDYGWPSWLLSIAGIGVFLLGLRDGVAARNVSHLERSLDLDLGDHKRLLISGGTGFIGTALCRELLNQGHNITLLSRQPIAASFKFDGKVRAIRSISELSKEEHFDVVINLAGAPVVGPLWTASRKAVLLGSRLNTTKDLLSFVRDASQKPQVWVQASAIGFYGPHRDHPVDENDEAGDGFAADLCQQWEELTDELESLSIRRVILRFGMVFGSSGGSLPMMLLSFRFGLGAILGNGQQHLSWIHLEDLLRLIAQAISDESIHGKINAVAPDNPTYQEFARLVGEQLHRPVFLRFPARLLRVFLGEMASLFVDGPKIRPTRLEKMNFNYHFSDLQSALKDLA